MTTRTTTAMGESTASRDRYKIQRFPSGWFGYCGKTRVKDFSNSKADAQAWLDMMNREELAAAESRDGAHEALFDITGTHFDEDKHECVYNNMSRMWHIYARPVKPARFTKIVSQLLVYGAGTITSAYLLDDGCVVGYCKDTKEWLKWNSKGQLHTSCGKTREDAAMLFNDEPASWCNNNMVENAKIIAEARTKPTHSERVRAISARRDARRAKRRATLSTLLAVIVSATLVRADDHEKRDRHESHNYIIERQQTGSVSSGSTPTLRLINGSRETDVYRDGSMFERNNMVGVRR